MKKYLFFIAIFLFSFTSCAPRIVSPAPSTKVVVIKKAPRQHKVVFVKGKRYYKWNDQYHRKTRFGYIVVRF
ncbi:hypothetical protein BXY75_1034 [Ulvibacter antarcticus]|uniref:Lipoprotein n=1 Tax=Ulvibacter antarcticus TaxID=442714 RepID=A0A3L9YU40_9FLAO|nr:hypothetical protein BXY75_1034 [Ulvibacter antarcticus]